MMLDMFIYSLRVLERSTTTIAQISYNFKYFFKIKWANPGFFFIYFHLFKQTLQFLQQINAKNVHPVSGARIQTHKLLITSLLP